MNTTGVFEYSVIEDIKILKFRRKIRRLRPVFNLILKDDVA